MDESPAHTEAVPVGQDTVGIEQASPVASDVRTPETRTSPVSGRIRGLDMARALAIIGMVMVHFARFEVDVDDPSGFVYETSHGRASILFIVLAGVGVSLLAGDRSPDRLRGTTTRLLYRAAVLLPMGLALQALDTGVAVILQYYAVYFLIAAPAMHLGDRWLLRGSLALTILAPTLYLAGWFWRPDWYRPGPSPGLAQPVDLVRDLLLTGYYPAVVWSAPLLFGMWLGRRDLRAVQTRRALVMGGAAAATVAYLTAWRVTAALGAPAKDASSWRWLAVAEPHSEMPLWLVSAVAVACAIIGASLYATRWLSRLTWPFVAAGQLALSIYVVHLLVLAWVPGWLVRDALTPAAVSVLRFTVVALAGAALWRAVFRRGPLELLLHLPFRH